MHHIRRVGGRAVIAQALRDRLHSLPDRALLRRVNRSEVRLCWCRVRDGSSPTEIFNLAHESSRVTTQLVLRRGGMLYTAQGWENRDCPGVQIKEHVLRCRAAQGENESISVASTPDGKFVVTHMAATCH